MTNLVLTPSRRVSAAKRIAERLSAAGSIAVCTHVGGDGDGWGSACALAHHFGTRADVRLLAATPMPERFAFLLPAGVRTIAPDEAGLAAARGAEVQVVVDASQPDRLGDFEPAYESPRTVVIDHHAVTSQRIEATLELIDATAAATAELVYDILLQAGDLVSPATATALYVGLVTDTGSFRYSNSTPHAHRVAAKLIENGADPESLYRPLFANLTCAELGTLRAAIERLQRDEEMGITWSALDASIAGEFGALDEYEEVIDHLRNLQGTEVAVLFREMNGGTVKVSFRSTGKTDVAAVARSFGGGGHEKAAGATLEGELSGAVERVLAACRAALRGAR
ncbi:MAG TPA: bifunctional oligoribonuclease/PAP phosphatase NrnA [Gemmatimonadota bacterium]|nr:bifunctional oligoribonuclease/PAP phosphatase NrnA [Gemmatimonadota bacterium]